MRDREPETSGATSRAGIGGDETGDFSAEGAGFHSPRQRLGKKIPPYSSPERATAQKIVCNKADAHSGLISGGIDFQERLSKKGAKFVS